MRFVHTSDLHLGRRLAQMSLEEDMAKVLSDLKDLTVRTKAHALIVAGDIYDSPNPPETAVRQWDHFITEMADLGLAVLAVSGNHDSGARLAVGADLIARTGIHLAGELDDAIVPVVVDGVNFWLVPFVRPAEVRAWAETQGIDASGVGASYDAALNLVLSQIKKSQAFRERPNVCVAHQFVTSSGTAPERSDSEQLSLGTLDNVDASAFAGFDYVALGHIHRPQRIGADTIRYAGSPLKLSSSEISQTKSFCVVGITETADGTQVKHRLIDVEPLRDFRKVTGTVDELCKAASLEAEAERNDFIHAVVTDDDPLDVMARLRQVWPNIAQVTFDNATTRAAGADIVADEVDLTKDMLDLFSEFFEAQLGHALAADERKLVVDAFEAAREKEGDRA